MMISVISGACFLIKPAAGCHIDLAAYDRLDTGFPCSPVEVNNPIHYTMIGNGNRFMPPFSGTGNDIFYIRNPIHFTHFGMAMKLHAFHRCQIHPFRPKGLALHDSPDRCNTDIIIKPIQNSHAFNHDKLSIS